MPGLKRAHFREQQSFRIRYLNKPLMASKSISVVLLYISFIFFICSTSFMCSLLMARVDITGYLDNEHKYNPRRSGYNINVTPHADLLKLTPRQLTTAHPYVTHNATVGIPMDVLDKYLDNLQVDYMPYLAEYRNPCWFDNITAPNHYANNYYHRTEPEHYRNYFLKKELELKKKKGPLQHLRCIPLVYQIGFAKCGTTELYSHLIQHPWIVEGAYKEPHFWNKRHFQGLDKANKKRTLGNVPFAEYVDLYDDAANDMRNIAVGNDSVYHPAVTIDASVYYAYEFTYWEFLPQNQGLDAPEYHTAHFIRQLVPGAKIIAIIRDPVERLYSDYNFFQGSFGRKVSPAEFHKAANLSVYHMQQCLESHSLRHCAYYRETYGDLMDDKHHGKNLVDLGCGMYYAFLKDWMEVFPKDQVLVVRLEDHKEDPINRTKSLFNFLGIPPKEITIKKTATNKGTQHKPMLQETRLLLEDFYRPFNEMLADYLNDPSFDYSLFYTKEQTSNQTTNVSTEQSQNNTVLRNIEKSVLSS